jgi:hypothetical protein
MEIDIKIGDVVFTVAENAPATEHETFEIAFRAGVIPSGERAGEVLTLLPLLAKDIDLLSQGEAGKIVLAWQRRKSRRADATTREKWMEGIFDWGFLIASASNARAEKVRLEALTDAHNAEVAHREEEGDAGECARITAILQERNLSSPCEQAA